MRRLQMPRKTRPVVLRGSRSFRPSKHIPPRRAAMANAPGLRDLWLSRRRNPDWQAWMDHGVWSDADCSELLRARRVPTRLPLPYFTAPEQLTAPAAEKLGEAVAAFERRMAETQVAPYIADMLTESKKTEYLLNTKEGEFRLYLPETREGAVSEKTGKPYKLKFVPVFQLIEPDAGHFKTLLDFHLPEKAFKAFRAHVSRYPGCDAEKVPLTDEEKRARGERRKYATETRVAISAEGVYAFREGGEWPMSDAMQHAVRFFDARVATVGKPIETRRSRWAAASGYTFPVDFKLAPWRVASVERPNWRFKEADPNTGDPDDARKGFRV